MKIGITGHTSGIGKYMFDKHGSKGWSTSTGFDLTDPKARQEMINDAEDIDVFINNADDGNNMKLDVMKDIWSAWRTKPKILVNLGSYRTFQAKVQAVTKKDVVKNEDEQYNFYDEILPLQSELAVGLIQLGPVGTEHTISKGLDKYITVEDASNIVFTTVKHLQSNHRMFIQIMCKGYHK